MFPIWKFNVDFLPNVWYHLSIRNSAVYIGKEVSRVSSFSYFVGQRIKKYRKSRGYTIEQFSTMINKSKATLSKY